MRVENFNFNIVRWYPFENCKSILQIGTNEKISSELKKIFNKVVTVENTNKISKNKEKFNYILLYGYEKYNENIKNLVDLLEIDGTILIVGNNEFGINTWSKYCSKEDEGVQRLEKSNLKLTNILELEKELEKEDFNFNIFYAFPNYKEAEIIVNEKLDIQKSHIEKYNPYIQESDIKIFDEIEVLKTIVNANPRILEVLANSYIIEASRKTIKTDIRYCSFNNSRKAQYRLMTIIKDNLVEKVATNEKAKEHLRNMKDIIEKMKQENIEILDYEQDGHIYSKLIKGEKTLDRILFDNRENLDEIVRILNEIRDILLKNSKENNIENIYNIKQEDFIKMHILEDAFWDMVPKNCFYLDNKYIFFDQEWSNKYLPVEYIIYRSVINSYDLVRKINVDELLEKLEILQYKEDFERIDNELRIQTIDNDIYETMYKAKEIKAIDNMINENKFWVQENDKKDQYIKELERYIESLKDDNSKKQEYIETLQRIVEESKTERD